MWLPESNILRRIVDHMKCENGQIGLTRYTCRKSNYNSLRPILSVYIDILGCPKTNVQF